MIPFILGGVALAVTGYGIGKLFEDDVPYSRNSIRSYSESDLSDVIDKFQDMKSRLYETTLKELQTALKEINNLEKDIEISMPNQYDFLTLNDNAEEILNKYINILEEAKSFIDTQLDKIDELIMKSSDYKVYNDEEKECIQKLIDLNNLIVKATQSKMTLDGETIARDVKRAFGKIEIILK